jgi:DNA-binding CsgD family transcriptional regulator
MEAIQNHIPPGLAANELEIYWDANKQDLFGLHEGRKHQFAELPQHILGLVAEIMHADEEALRIFESHGPKLLADRLFSYAKCNFGGFSFTADLQNNVADKESWNCGCNGNCILQPITRGFAHTVNGTLTKRELEVLRALCSPPYKIGAAIAYDLGISEHTLNTHKRSIFEKCAVQSIQELAVLATKNNWV